MRYLNPFDLLNTKINSVSEINIIDVKKSKKRILAEIELSDDASISIKNIKFFKSDCLKAFDELEDKDKLEFYFFIYQYQELNNFLYNGVTKFFVNFRHESIFDLPEFIDFLSPYFAPKYTYVLLKVLEKKSCKALEILNSIPILVNTEYLDHAFHGAYNFIQNIIKWIDNISKEIKNGTSVYNEDNIEKLIENFNQKIHIKTINLLPSYFQEVRNNLSYALRNLSINIFNNIGDSEASVKLLQYALNIKIDDLIKNNFQKDLSQIEEINTERKETEKYEPIIVQTLDQCSL